MIAQRSALLHARWAELNRALISLSAVAAYLLAYVSSKGRLGEGFGGFPEELRVPFQEPIDAAFLWFGDSLTWLFDPIAFVINSSLSSLETFLLWIPWAGIAAAVVLLAFRLGGWRTALFSAVGLLLIAAIGLWDSAMLTMSLMGISVLIAVAIGMPMGILAALNDRAERTIRPILDMMQVLPPFVYLMPALFLFGVGGTVSVFLTVVYAIPPTIRLTNLGIRKVPKEMTETAWSHGSTTLQTLVHVQIPMAKPTIMMGINQTIMMALAMVIITALVGATGLGLDVWNALSRIDSGSGFEAGMGIVIIAIIFDRLSYALVRQGSVGQAVGGHASSYRDRRTARTLGKRLRGFVLLIGVALAVSLISVALGIRDYPGAWQFSTTAIVNDAVDWASIHLYFFTSWTRDSLIRELGLAPVQAALNWFPWPVLILGMTFGVYALAGKKAAVLTCLSFLFFGLSGVWELVLHTLSQVLVAVVLSVVVGVAVGIMASRSNVIEAFIRPILDVMQTMPVFVYLIPVVMLWGSGPIAAIIATVIYAIPPSVRMTNLGIRLVQKEVIETAQSHGASPLQVLLHVQIPLAMPSIKMGVNQTIIMALAMVIVGGLIGGGGLGQEVYVSSVYMRMGQGVVAGLSIVLLAMILDRITQGRRSQSQAFAFGGR